MEEIDEFYNITREELKKLSDNPKKELTSFDGLYASNGFKRSYQSGIPANIAMKRFVDYYQSNEDIFSDWVKQFCMNSVVKVAKAYGGIVKEEQEIIDELKTIFLIKK